VAPGGGKEWKRSEVHVLRSVSTAGKAETDIKERNRNTGGKGKSEMERGEWRETLLRTGGVSNMDEKKVIMFGKKKHIDIA
jgi:hypothetical protein